MHGHGVIPAWAMPRAALGLTCLRVPRSIGSQQQLSSVSSLGRCSQEETEVQSGDFNARFFPSATPYNLLMKQRPGAPTELDQLLKTATEQCCSTAVRRALKMPAWTLCDRALFLEALVIQWPAALSAFGQQLTYTPMHKAEHLPVMCYGR